MSQEMSVQDMTQGLKSWHHICQIPDFSVEIETTALLVIDLTYQQASRYHGTLKRLVENGFADDSEYFISRIEETVVPNVAQLVDAFRASRAPVIHTLRIACRRRLGSDLAAPLVRSPVLA